MEISKKLLVLGLLLFALSWQVSGHFLTLTHSELSLASYFGGGSIVVEDDVIFITSGDQTDPVDEVSVYDSNHNLVHHACSHGQSTYCIDCSHLDNGNYQVYVVTANNSYFSSNILLE